MSSGAPEETPKPNQESSQTQTGQAELPPSKTPLLSLPAPGDVTSHSSISASLNSDGSISMDHLGPMVINTDGSISRINNWSTMTQAEKERTLRVVGKRNQVRKEALLKESNQE